MCLCVFLFVRYILCTSTTTSFSRPYYSSLSDVSHFSLVLLFHFVPEVWYVHYSVDYISSFFFCPWVRFFFFFFFFFLVIICFALLCFFRFSFFLSFSSLLSFLYSFLLFFSVFTVFLSFFFKPVFDRKKIATSNLQLLPFQT